MEYCAKVGRAYGQLPIWLTVSFILVVSAVAQEQPDRELAQLLANAGTREKAVTKIVASGTNKVPVLLSWTGVPPRGVDNYELLVGLADVFAQLRTKEAIPFLVAHVGLKRHRYVDFQPLLKVPEVVEEAYPSAAALIRIGHDAATALILHSNEAKSDDDRLAGIFVVARVSSSATGDKEGYRRFLLSAISQANTEKRWAEEGLKYSGEPK